MSESSYRRAVEQQNRESQTSQTSEARLAANRANAQLSRGPVSAGGKAKVCLNAVKTGLTGRTVLLPTDDAEKYQALILEFEKDLQPIGPQERALVQSIVDCHWRLERIPGLEIALLSITRQELAEKDPDYNISNLAAVIEMQLRRHYQKDFRNLQLQESRLARRREKEMAELLRLQQARKAKETEALNRAAQAYLLARHRNQPFNLTELGFEFSTQKFEAHLATLSSIRKQELLQMALAETAEPMKVAA